MATFDKVFRQEKNGKAAGPVTAPESAKIKLSRDEFMAAFKRMTVEVAKPQFEDLIRVAKGRGYAATLQEGYDENDNPYYGLTFVPETGVKIGAKGHNECIFQLKGVWPEQIIEYTSCHDMRPGKKGGIIVTKSDLPSLNKVFLEAEIEQFITFSLEAREPK